MSSCLKIWRRSVKKQFALCLLITGLFSANSAIAQQYPRWPVYPLPPILVNPYSYSPPYFPFNSPNFRATGKHQCQSATSIGHWCTTFGVNFSDCTEAHVKLKMQDCCHHTPQGGISIFYQPVSCGII